MTQSKHTPTPWRVDFLSDCHKRQRPYISNTDDRNHRAIAEINYAWQNGTDSGVQRIDEANAAFIVKAVNNHEKLIRMLEAVLNTAETYGLSKGDYIDARELLAAAKGDA